MSPVIRGASEVSNTHRGTASEGVSKSVWQGLYPQETWRNLWQLSEQSIRRLFQDEPGVFILGDDNPRGRRGYQTLRIPEAVAMRVWTFGAHEN